MIDIPKSVFGDPALPAALNEETVLSNSSQKQIGL